MCNVRGVVEYQNNVIYSIINMFVDKSTKQDRTDNQIMISNEKRSVDLLKAKKRKPLQFKQPPRLYSLDDPSIEQSRLELKQLQEIDMVSTIAHRNPDIVRKKLPPIEQEKVEDYRQKIKNYVEIGGKKYRYSPADAVVLDDYVPEPILTQDDKDNAMTDKRNLAIEIQRLERDRRNTSRLVDQLKARLDESSYTNRDTIVSRIAEAEQTVLDIEQNIRTAQGYIFAIDAQLSLNQANETSVNPRRKASVEESNRRKVREYESMLKTLNQGKFNIQQQPNESDEEYLKRLEDESEQEYDDTIDKQKADQFNVLALKDNLRKITRDVGIVEFIINSLKPNEIYHTNKHWGFLEKAFKQEYGSDNRVLTGEDYVLFILEFIYPGSSSEVIERDDSSFDTSLPLEESSSETPTEKTPVPKKRSPRPEGSEKVVDELMDIIRQRDEQIGLERENYGKFFIALVGSESLYVQNNDNKKEFYLRRGSKNHILVSITDNQPGSFRVAGTAGNVKFQQGQMLKWLGEYTDAFEYPDNDIKEIFDGQISLKGTYNILKDKFKLKSTKENQLEEEDGTNYVGYGIPLSIPRGPVTFGSSKINLHKLFYDNILSVKRGRGGAYPGINNMRVTDDLVYILMSVLKGKLVTKSQLKGLSSNEKMIYDLMMKMSGLHKEVPYHDGGDEDHVDELKSRLAIVEGSIMAGNNNKSMLKELKDILMRLHHFKVISYAQATGHFKQIKKLYF